VAKARRGGGKGEKSALYLLVSPSPLLVPKPLWAGFGDTGLGQKLGGWLLFLPWPLARENQLRTTNITV